MIDLFENLAQLFGAIFFISLLISLSFYIKK